MKPWLRDILYCEFPPDMEEAVLGRVLMFNIFLMVYLATAIPFSIFHAARGAYIMAVVLLAGAALLVGIREYIRTTRNHRLGFTIAVFLPLPTFLANFITGGTLNCGPLWHYCYPMVTLLLIGPLWGSVASLTLIGLSWLLLAAPFNELMMTSYTPEFLVRFSISYLIVYLLAFIYEFQKSRASKRLKLLSGLLPICANCKKIRDDRGSWNQIETYIQKHSDTEFSHSICPECAQKLYPDLELKK